MIMFRSMTRASLASQIAMPCRATSRTFSTRSILRQSQDSEGKGHLSNLNNKDGADSSQSQTVNESGSSTSTTTTPANSESSPISSIPFVHKAKTGNESEGIKGNGTDAWLEILSLLPKPSNSSDDGNFGGGISRRTPRLDTSIESEPLDPVTRFEALWRQRDRTGPDSPAKPSDGRVFIVKPNFDVNRAYIQLSSLLARNGVKRELRLQERYEKPNQKRRRLKSERHRRRFAAAVKEKVQLVMELQARGV